MNIYVGNLSKSATEEELTNLFSEYGQVSSAKIIRDLFSQESRGFAFIEMPGLAEAQKAIEELNSKEFKGQNLVVNEARPKRDNRKRNDSRSGGGQKRRRF